MSQPIIWKPEHISTLRAIAHYYGSERFLQLLAEISYRASSDTEDFENKNLSRIWNEVGFRINQILEDIDWKDRC